MKKRILCLTLVFGILLAVVGINIYAEESTSAGAQLQTIEIKTGDNLYTSNDGVRLFSLNNYEELYDAVFEAIKNKQNDLDVTKFNMTPSDFGFIGGVIYDVVFENPELFYAHSAWSPTYYPTLVKSIGFSYTEHTSNEDAERFFSKVNYIISSTVHEGMSDAEKALVLHDYIVDTASYYENPDPGNNEYPIDAYTSYMVLMQNTGVCQGYSLAYNLLLNRVGIETKFVSSESMKHGWSMVKLDGEWYHVDTTHDDPVFAAEEGEERYEEVRHDNFLLSDTGISATGHSDWDSDAPECTSTKYEDSEYCFTDATDVLEYVDGRYYNIKYVEVSPSELVYGEDYIQNPITEQIYLVKRRASSFDCTDEVKITQEQYDAAGTELKELYRPIIFKNGVAEYAALEDFASSEVYVKTDTAISAQNSISICFYDEDKHLIEAKTPDVTSYEGFARIKPVSVPNGAVSAKIMYWDRSAFAPLSNFIEL